MMARKKVKLAWIANDGARRATFKKRKKGIMKKVSELSTLCGVSACAIIYGPYEAEAEVWPSPSEAKRVVARFRTLPDMEQCKKMMNQEEFLRQRISKVKEQLKRQLKDNQDKDNTKLIFHLLAAADHDNPLHHLGLDALADLVCLLDAKIKAIRDRIELLGRRRTTTPPPPAINIAPPLPPPSNPQYPQYIHIPDDQKIEIREAKTEGGGEDNNMTIHDDHQMAAMARDGLHAGQPSPWFMDVNAMNHNHQHMMAFAANDMLMSSYMDNINPWSNPFFP